MLHRFLVYLPLIQGKLDFASKNLLNFKNFLLLNKNNRLRGQGGL